MAAYNGVSGEGLPLLECLSVLRGDSSGKLYFGEDNTSPYFSFDSLLMLIQYLEQKLNNFEDSPYHKV